MTLRTLVLQNFRSYTKKTLEFSQETVLITGANASGKTNVLESIMLMATGKSFRAGADREVIRWDSAVTRVTGQISQLEEQIQLELLMTPGEVLGRITPLKKYFVNGIPRRMIDFIGNLQAVLFWPEDLDIITDSPSTRRRYLDAVLIQIDREYRRNLLSYERALRQRNKLLDDINEGKASRSQLLFWNQLLIKAGAYLTEARHAFIDYINGTNLINHHFVIVYDKSVISENRLEQYKNEEVAAKATLVGPHRDDFRVEQDNKDISAYGSRGEQRVAVLWLKLAEIDYIELVRKVRPMLLLDDIFSELDDIHRKLVVDVIRKQQTIVTSAERDIISVLPQQTLTIML